MQTNRRKFLGIAFATAAFATLGAAAASAATVEEIKAKGALVVGIQGDNAPCPGDGSAARDLCFSI